MAHVPSDDTRMRLLSVAGETFAELGFKGATTRDICRRAAANGAAVNYYFRDKQGLYQAAVEEAHACAPELATPAWPPDFSTADKLRGFISTFLTQLLDPRRPAWHTRLMLREMAEPTAACAQLVEAYIRPMANTLREILDDALPSRMSEAERWMIGFSIVGQCLFYRVHRPVAELLVGRAEYGQIPVGALADHISRFCLAALGIGAAPFFNQPTESAP